MAFYRRRRTTYSRRPYRYIRRRPRTMRRKTYGSRRSKSNFRGLTSLGTSGFPRCLYTKLNYSIVADPFAFTAPDITPIVRVMRANGPYDPEYSVGGGQPRFYDTLLGADSASAPYHTYTVYGCKVDATIQTANGTAVHWYVGFRDANASGPTSIKQAIETRGYKVKHMAEHQGGPSVQRMSMYVPINRVVGKSKRAIMDDDNYSSEYNTTPASEVLCDIGCAPVASSTSTYYITIKITYYMKCWNLNNVDDS